jgi:hypothetical protein
MTFNREKGELNMKGLITSVVFLVVVAGAFGYCEEFNMDLTISSGGSGDFEIKYDSTDPAYCSEDTGADIVSEYVGSGGDLDDIVVTAYGPSANRVEVSYDVTFDSIEGTDVTDDYGVFGFFPDIDYTIDLTENENYDYRNSITAKCPNDDDYKEYMYTFNVTCPNRIVSTNGNETNSYSVYWEYSLYELVDNGTTDLTITYASE